MNSLLVYIAFDVFLIYINLGVGKPNAFSWFAAGFISALTLVKVLLYYIEARYEQT